VCLKTKDTRIILSFEAPKETMTFKFDQLQEVNANPPPKNCNEAAALVFPLAAKTSPAFVELENTSVTSLPILQLLDLQDDFWAMTLENTVYMLSEGQFRQYDSRTGLYAPVQESALVSQIQANLIKCSHEFPSCLKYDSFQQLKTRQRIKGVVERAREVWGRDDAFFQAQSPYLINCANGILNVVTREFKPFSPSFPIRDVLPVKYDPDAKPDFFLKSFLNHILSFNDMDLLQRFCGQLLLGRNHAQKILILTGESGWGKSTLMKILCTILGWERVGIVREQLFKDDMELGHYAEKHLLYGPDMNSQFLNRKESSLFKQLVGNDPIWAETKDSGRIIIEGCFPLVLACNTRPQIMLDHDTEAWARRLVVLEFKKPGHERHLGKLADILVQKELSGVLNWLLDGFAKLHSSGLQLTLTEEQQTRANLLLTQSESPQAFVHRCIVKKADGEVGALELYEKYQDWCQAHQLVAFPSKEFHKMAKNELELRFGLRYRHDLESGNGGVIRGWKGLALLEDANLKTGSTESGSQSVEYAK
jgi:P4 family phage/plasmid primase-like protien